MANLYKGVGRNDPCPCGSGKKFKKCCLDAQGVSQLSPVLRPADPQPGDLARSAPAGEALVHSYDPLSAPQPERWLALDEQERIDLVLDYHERN